MPEDKKKYKGKYLESFKKDIDEMVARSKERQGTKAEPKPSGSATVKDAPNGKPYAGPAFGERKGGQVEYKKPESKKEDKPKQSSGRAMSAAEQRYMTERDRRKKNESPVVGS
jgi:hypothetical protein